MTVPVLAILVFLSLLLALYSLRALAEVVLTVRRVPAARTGLKLSLNDHPSVCTITPAHNEADVIAAHVRSLRDQTYPNLRSVLVLDRCTDQTGAIARALVGHNPGARIISVDDCPVGVAGKAHAAWIGFWHAPEARAADLLLFLDADTVLAPACVRAAVALLQSEKLDLLSMLPKLTDRRWYERFLQPAAALELIHQYPVRRVNRREEPMAFATGQFLLFSRRAYQRIGTHHAVRRELLEDIALARQMVEHGFRLGLVPAGPLLTCRMYRSWPTFSTGWRRIFREAAHRRPGRLARNAGRLALTSAVLPAATAVALALAAPHHWAWASIPAIALVIWVTQIAAAHRAAMLPLAAALVYPLGGLCIAVLLLIAAADLLRDRPIAWAGRTYRRAAR